MSDPQPANGSRLDRIENALAHLLETQANQEIRLDRFLEALQKLEQNHQQLLTAQVLLTDAQRKIVEAQIKTEERLGLLADAQLRLFDNQQRLEAAYERLTQSQQHTEERLNALIQIVDEIIRRRPPEQT